MRDTMKNHKAFSIIELLVASLIIVIVAMVGASFDTAMRTQAKNVQIRVQAFSSAIAQIEDLKYIAKSNFSDSLLDAVTDHASTLGEAGVTYTITDGTDWGEDGDTSATDIDYKIIDVTSTYGIPAKIIQLKTYIADIN